MVKHLREMVDKGEVSMKRAHKFLRRFGLDVDALRPKTRTMSQAAKKHFAGVATASEDTSKTVQGSFSSMVDGASDAIELLKTNTNNALSAMGAKTVNFAVKKASSAVAKGARGILRKQRG